MVAWVVSTLRSSTMMGADSLVAADAPTTSVTTTPLPIAPSDALTLNASDTVDCDNSVPFDA